MEGLPLSILQHKAQTVLLESLTIRKIELSPGSPSRRGVEPELRQKQPSSVVMTIETKEKRTDKREEDVSGQEKVPAEKLLLRSHPSNIYNSQK